MPPALRLLLLLIALVLAQVSSANGGRWASNEVNGYGMWAYGLGFFDSNGKWASGKKWHWYINILFNESKSVFESCKKKGRIYIYGGSNDGYSCSIASVRKYTKSPSEDEYTIAIDATNKPPRASTSTIIISTTSFPISIAVNGAFTPSEIKKISSLINEEKIERKSCCKYKPLKGLSNAQINPMRHEEEGHSENYYLKLRIANKTLYILPALLVDDGASSQIVSAVFINDGSLRTLGFIDGEYGSVAPDIDGDGFPEVLFREGNSEGGVEKCIKLYPKTEILLEYGSS